jgi:hypothetical protein
LHRKLNSPLSFGYHQQRGCISEPTITCPNYKTEIKLSESLPAMLIASTRQLFETQ